MSRGSKPILGHTEHITASTIDEGTQAVPKFSTRSFTTTEKTLFDLPELSLVFSSLFSILPPSAHRRADNFIFSEKARRIEDVSKLLQPR